MQEKTQSQAWGSAPRVGVGLGEESQAAHFLQESFFKEPNIQTGSQGDTGRLVRFDHFPSFLRGLEGGLEGQSQDKRGQQEPPRPKVRNF